MKKMICAMLSFVLMFSVLTVTASAEEASPITEQTEPAEEATQGEEQTEELPQYVDSAVSGDYSYSVSGGKATITEYIGVREQEGSLVIPSAIDGYPVTAIGDEAFMFCEFFTGLTIPGSVETIGDYAFAGGCGFTGSLTIPNGVKSIGAYAFDFCCGFNGTLKLPNSLETIGEGAFLQCSGLTGRLKIPNGVKTIGGAAFAGCYGLTGSLKIPSSVTTIGGGAFANCPGLTGNVKIPRTVTTIEYAPFYGCDRLTSITVDPGNPNYKAIDGILYNRAATELIQCPTRKKGSIKIPSSVKSINDCAFYDCQGLTGSLIIPSSVTHIGYQAFFSCYNIEEIYFTSDISPTFDDECFLRYDDCCMISIPEGSYAEYFDIYERYDDGCVEITEKEIDTQPLPAPEGFYIISMEDGRPILKWRAVAKTYKYAIYRSPSETGEFLCIGYTNDTRYMDADFTNDSTYYYKIAAYKTVKDEMKFGDPSKTVGYKVLANPETVTAKRNMSADGIKLTWSTVEEAANYLICRKKIGNPIYRVLKRVTGCTYTDTSTQTGSEYEYIVFAASKIGDRHCYSTGCSAVTG